MKSQVKTISLFVLSLFVVLISCNKDDPSTPSESLTRTQLLTQKAWIQTAGRTKTGSSDWTETFSAKEACNKDDEYVFKTDGTFNYNEGRSKCDPDDPQVFDQGSWLLTAGETIISTSAVGGGGDDLYIIKLDKATLVFEERFGSTIIEYTISHP